MKAPYSLLTTTVLALSCGLAAVAAEPPLVALDASILPEGPITAWTNGGALAGVFQSAGSPQVKLVDGVKAIAFGGKDYFLADFHGPDPITGDRPWTVIVRTRCTEIRGEHALVAWACRPGNCLEIEYGAPLNWRAVGTWNDPNTLGWNRQSPAPAQWHTLVYTYAGGLAPAFEPQLAGMLWMQGESDTGNAKLAEEYGRNLAAFIKDIRAETKSPSLPFVLARISNADACKAYGDVVRTAEATVAKAVPNTATFLTADYGMCDPWHYDTAGMVSLGQRFAQAMRELEQRR